MAKRSRGSGRSGQRRPTQRPSGRPAPRPATPAGARVVAPAEGLSDVEEARAAEIEARIVAEERAADAARVRGRERSRPDTQVRGGGRVQGSLLATRSAEEYTYVVRDLRRIATLGGTAVGVMVILFILIDILHVVSV